jgi:hypothetical protein
VGENGVVSWGFTADFPDQVRAETNTAHTHPLTHPITLTHPLTPTHPLTITHPLAGSLVHPSAADVTDLPPPSDQAAKRAVKIPATQVRHCLLAVASLLLSGTSLTPLLHALVACLAW